MASHIHNTSVTWRLAELHGCLFYVVYLCSSFPLSEYLGTSIQERVRYVIKKIVVELSDVNYIIITSVVTYSLYIIYDVKISKMLVCLFVVCG